MQRSPYGYSDQGVLSLTRTVAPTAHPVTLAECKQQCRIDTDITEHDAEFDAYINAAVTAAEDYQNRQLITATYTMTLSDFPGLAGPIYIPRSPVQSITSIVYSDVLGSTKTWSSDNYTLIKGSVGGYINSNYEINWPQTLNHYGAENITITFVAGYGNSPADVPATTRQAIRMMVADLFENHEMSGVDSLKPNRTAEMLLNLNRVVPVA